MKAWGRWKCEWRISPLWAKKNTTQLNDSHNSEYPGIKGRPDNKFPTKSIYALNLSEQKSTRVSQSLRHKLTNTFHASVAQYNHLNYQFDRYKCCSKTKKMCSCSKVKDILRRRFRRNETEWLRIVSAYLKIKEIGLHMSHAALKDNLTGQMEFESENEIFPL